MHPKTLSEEIDDAAARIETLERELRTAQSYLLQARTKYDALLRQYREENFSTAEAK